MTHTCDIGEDSNKYGMIPFELAHGVKISINKSIERLILHVHKDLGRVAFTALLLRDGQ